MSGVRLGGVHMSGVHMSGVRLGVGRARGTSARPPSTQHSVRRARLQRERALQPQLERVVGTQLDVLTLRQVAPL